MTDLVGMLAMMGGPAAQGGGSSLGGMMIPMLIIFGIMYFMLIRPQQRREKERRALIDNIKSGEKVLFGGGILGTVTNVKEGTFIVKIADGVKVEVARGSVTKVLDKGEKVSKDEELS